MKIVCERRYDEGLRTFKDNTIGAIRTIDSGGAKRVVEYEKREGVIYFPKGYLEDDSDTITVCESDELEEYRIRKLTPKECFRLMGFSDEDFNKAEAAGISNSQLYKQAGNSIVVDVLYHIYKQLYKVMPYLFDDLKLSSFFSGIGAFESGLDRLYIDINTGKI